MEQFKSTEETNRLVAEVTECLHNLTGGNDDPEKKKIALELVEKIKAEKDDVKRIKLMKELNDLYDPNRKEEEPEPVPSESKDSVLRQAEDSGEAMEQAPDVENLESNGTVTVGPLEGEFDPNEFFSNDNKSVKLYIRDSFKNKIEASAERDDKPLSAICSYTLKKAMNYSEIDAKLPVCGYFSHDDYWMIAELLKKQPNGESGELLNDGKANLFYVQVGVGIRVVGVSWDEGAWCVDGWVQGEYNRWLDGSRVFSRNR